MTTSSEKPSFLQNLISSAAKPETSSKGHKVKDIEKNIEILKKDVCESMRSHYKNFDKFEANDEKDFAKCQLVVKEMDELSNKIENEITSELASSTQELNKLKESLVETSLSLSLVGQLVSIKNNLDVFVKALSEGRYVAAARDLQKVRDLLANPKDKANHLDLFQAFSEECSKQDSNLRHSVFEAWHNFFSWEENEDTSNKKTTNFKVLKSEVLDLKDIVEAFLLLFEASFYHFAKGLLQNIYIPIITQSTEVNAFHSQSHGTLSIEIHQWGPEPNVGIIVSNITKVNEFLIKEMSISLENGESLLKLLGCTMSEEFSDTFIKKCLMVTLPSSRQEMNQYSETLEQLKNFANDLSTTGFLEADGILDYIGKVEVLSVEKSCAVFLEKSRTIMKKDLLHSVAIEPDRPSVTLDSIMPKALDLQDTNNKTKLPVDLRQMFSFPPCRVSKWTLELMKLVEDVLDESHQHAEEDQWAFCQTARDIFILYLSVVPVYHHKYLEKIPQLVALFHNNNMYLAHRLLTLGFEYQAHLDPSPKNQLIFVDLIEPLRNLGTDAFLRLLHEQRRVLLDLTKDSGLATIGESPEFPSTIEVAIRKCLRSLEHLGSVWKDILPEEVYHKSIGGLLHTLLEDIIARICTAEDISASAEKGLIAVFNIILDRAPKVFKVQNEVLRHVRNWNKFKELVWLLGSGLKDIEERWMQGSGVLAYEFTAEQIKHLIRALFQNTEVRATVLARIE